MVEKMLKAPKEELHYKILLINKISNMIEILKQQKKNGQIKKKKKDLRLKKRSKQLSKPKNDVHFNKH